jgi:hypothetical protein
VPVRGLFAAADLDVLFDGPPELGAGARVPYFAWSLRQREGCNPSPPVAFALPLGPTGGLELRLRVVPGASLGRPAAGGAGLGASAQPVRQQAGAPWRFETRFTVDWEPGRPRLRRGIYLLGLAPATWRRAVRLPGPGEPERMDLCSLVVSVEPLAGESP